MRRLAFIWMIALALPMLAQEPSEPADTTSVAKKPKKQVYQSTTVRIDLLNPILDLARSNWHTYSVEAAVSVRLLNRLFPTIELGHAGRFLQVKDAPVPAYSGYGEFVRLGLDVNPLKKHPESRSYMLIGVRAGTSWQKMPFLLSDTEKQGESTAEVLTGEATREPGAYTPERLNGTWIADAWGEVLAGVQVNIVKGFNMGWAIRMKFLFTTNSHSELSTPYYIPGFGYRDTSNWGFEYYLGYTF